MPDERQPTRAVYPTLQYTSVVVNNSCNCILTCSVTLVQQLIHEELITTCASSQKKSLGSIEVIEYNGIIACDKIRVSATETS